MRFVHFRIILAANLACSTAVLQAEISYGETVTVENKLGAVISPGWVITHETYSGPRFYSPHFPTRFFVTLVHLIGAPLGTTIEVLGSSPIPPGWIKIASRGTAGIECQSYNVRHILEKQFEADGAFLGLELPPITYGPIEIDVASMDFHRDEEMKKSWELEEMGRAGSRGTSSTQNSSSDGSSKSAWLPLPDPGKVSKGP
jgi:hypothetical protein